MKKPAAAATDWMRRRRNGVTAGRGAASDAAAVYEEPAQFFSYVLPPVLGVASFWLPSVVALGNIYFTGLGRRG